MKKDAILAMLRAIGADMSSVEENKEWVNCRCPLAPYTHSRGDSIPSFGVAINESGHSVWQCFGCSPKAKRLDKLITKLFLVSKKYPVQAARIYGQNENFVGGSRELNLPDIVYDSWEYNPTISSRLLPVSQKQPLPGERLIDFPLLQNDNSESASLCRQYLLNRGISLWAMYYTGTRFVKGKPVLIFPLTDHDSRIYTLRVRKIDAKKMWTISEEELGFEPQKIKQTGVWYNLHLMNWNKAITLVEGEIDANKAISFGFFNTLASSTGNVAYEQIENLRGNVYFLGYDMDKPGKRARESILDMAGRSAQFFDLDWTLVNKKDGTACEDPGDVVSKKDMQYVYRHAKYIS